MRRQLIVLCLSVVLLLNFPVFVYADTVDDLRVLLGRDIGDSAVSSVGSVLTKEVDDLFRRMAVTDISADIVLHGTVELLEAELSVSRLREDFVRVFSTGGAVYDVLRLYKSLLSAEAEVEGLGGEVVRTRATDVSRDEFFSLSSKLSTMTDSFDIGAITGLLSPVRDLFELRGVFGTSMTEGNVGVSKGIDLTVLPGRDILAQWNGVVSDIYKTDDGGFVVELAHGNSLRTVYGNLSKVLVTVGQAVRQYETLGWVLEAVADTSTGVESDALWDELITSEWGVQGGNTGSVVDSSEGIEEVKASVSFLHFEVYLDDIVVNPVTLYGDMGYLSYARWYTDNNFEAYGDILLDALNFVGGRDVTRAVDAKKGVILDDSYYDGMVVPHMADGYTPPNPGVVGGE